MKLLICIHGLIGGMHGKNGQGGNLNLGDLHNHIMEKIVIPNTDRLNPDFPRFTDIQFFIHSWSKDSEDQILNLFKPKKYIIEKQKYFHNVSDDNQRRFSKFYSLFKSIQLCDNYSKGGDVILSIRFDCHYKDNLEISYNSISNDDNKLVCFPKNDYRWDGNSINRISDYFFFGKKKDIFSYFTKEKYDYINGLMLNFDTRFVQNKDSHFATKLDNHTILLSIFTEFGHENDEPIEIIRHNLESITDVHVYRFIHNNKL